MELVSTEVSIERKTVLSKEAGQASGGGHHHHQPAGNATEETEERVNIIIHEKGGSLTSRTMEEKYASLNANKNTRSPKPLIQRVPYMFRSHKNFNKYYEPKVMAIGPLHHGPKFHLQPAEQHKLRLAGLFVKESGLDTEVLYNKICTEIKALREYFDQEETKSFADDQLAWMLFVDGCAVLCLIKYTLQKKFNQLEININQLVLLVSQDLFLLENQIPFRVLELLTSWDSDIQKQWRVDIEKFVALSIGTPTTDVIQIQEITEEQSPIHLLHLVRQMQRGNYPVNDQVSTLFNAVVEEEVYNWHTFRNVKYLKLLGICLQRSKTRLLADISFTSGKLKLPPIVVDESTGPRFMNLIAYEMCPDYDNDSMVNSYVCFLHSLVEKAEDVMELRKSSILLNRYGSDEEVVHLLNDISTHLTPNPTIYLDVKTDMKEHCNVPWLAWKAQVALDYLSSPLGVITIIGVVFTVIQTWLAVAQFK